jgi:hypothetical protein
MEKSENESFYIILPLYNSFNKNRGIDIQEEKKRKEKKKEDIMGTSIKIH